MHLAGIRNKETYLHILIILLISVLTNQYYGYIGINPIDNFTIYNSGFNVLNNKMPFKDYWTLTGPFLDLTQSVFFKLLGVNWFAYVFHASLLNFVFSIATYFTFLKFKLKNNYCLIYSIFLSLIFYPTVGTPFVDFHASVFSILGLYCFVLAVETNEKKYWFLIPWILTIGFLSKQTPTSYMVIIMVVLSVYYFYNQFNFKKIIFLTLSTGLVIILLLIFTKINEIHHKDFFEQYIIFASSLGAERLSGEYLFPVEFNRYILKFKLIHLSQIILIIVLIKNLIKNSNFLKNRDFLILLALISTVFAFIIHQLLTLNVKFIFFLIPIMAGFSHIFYEKYFLYSKKNIFIIIFLTLSFTSYYFVKYVDQRRFVVLEKYYDSNRIVKTNILDNNGSNFKWITHLSINTKEELKNLKKAVNFIMLDQRANELNGSIVITDYQFIFSKFDISNIMINKWYHPGVSYPSINNKNHKMYKEYLLNKIRIYNVNKIYFVKPSYFNNSDYFMKIFFPKCKKSENSLKDIVLIYDISKCY